MQFFAWRQSHQRTIESPSCHVIQLKDVKNQLVQTPGFSPDDGQDGELVEVSPDELHDLNSAVGKVSIDLDGELVEQAF